MGRTLGGFEIIGEIGRGGMGIVYKARQISLNRIVALKVLPSEVASDDGPAERFRREAHNMAQLRHPNIVDVIEVGEEDGSHYFAMQYVEGESLQDLIAREGALSPERSAELAAQVGDALFHAHERGMIHRDIKPGNILIDEHGRAVVTDFGIAKTMEGTGLTRTGMVIGVPEYMSPEVVRGNPIDGRSDIYSLGVVLYQMVAGRVPFTATTPVAVAMKHMSEAPQALRTLGADCPEWLESIIMKAMAKEPADRFGSAAEMAAALRSSVPVSLPTTEFPVQRPVAGARAPSGRVLRTIGAVGVLLMIGALAWWLLDTGKIPLLRAQMPNVVGLQASAARDVLRRRGHFGALLTSQYDDRAAGEVISQWPSAGVKLKRGSTVSLLASAGKSPTVKVPGLKGKQSEQARRELEAVDLNMEVTSEEPDESIPDGCVKTQDQPPGKQVDRGLTVRVVISTGPKKERVPGVTGETLEAARRTLEAKGFRVIENRPRHSDDPAGEVISQRPDAGTMQEPGDAVYIAVSLGPEPEPELRPGSLESRLIGTWRRTRSSDSNFGRAYFTFRSKGRYSYREPRTSGKDYTHSGRWWVEETPYEDRLWFRHDDGTEGYWSCELRGSLPTLRLERQRERKWTELVPD